MNRVVRDLAVHPHLSFAVVWEDELLPIRFLTHEEGLQHLYCLREKVVVLNPDLPAHVEAGRSLA